MSSAFRFLDKDDDIDCDGVRLLIAILVFNDDAPVVKADEDDGTLSSLSGLWFVLSLSVSFGYSYIA